MLYLRLADFWSSMEGLWLRLVHAVTVWPGWNWPGWTWGGWGALGALFAFIALASVILGYAQLTDQIKHRPALGLSLHVEEGAWLPPGPAALHVELRPMGSDVIHEALFYSHGVSAVNAETATRPVMSAESTPIAADIKVPVTTDLIGSWRPATDTWIGVIWRRQHGRAFLQEGWRVKIRGTQNSDDRLVDERWKRYRINFGHKRRGRWVASKHGRNYDDFTM